MEPEISISATIGGGLRRGPRYLRSITAPPALRLARSVRRMSIRWPWRCGLEPPRLHLVERQHQPLDRLLGGGDLGRRHLGEILLLQHLAIGHREAGVDLGLAPVRARIRAGSRTAPPRCAARRAWAPRARPAAPAAATTPSACRERRACERRCGTPDRTAACARAASRTPHAASSRNPRACRCRPPASAASASSTAPEPIGMPAARNARAK